MSSSLCTSAAHGGQFKWPSSHIIGAFSCTEPAGDDDASVFEISVWMPHTSKRYWTPGTFRVHPDIKSAVIELVVIGLLMWPQRTYITRDIVATDGGNRSTSVELTVTITNVKNQPPEWEQENYSVVIAENTARDTPIVVRAQLYWNYSCASWAEKVLCKSPVYKSY